MDIFRINAKIMDKENRAGRNSIGGNAILPNGHEYPQCGECGKDMLLFLQFDIQDKFNLSPTTGSHFCIFACPEHDEIPAFYTPKRLPKNYWEKTNKCCYAIIFDAEYEDHYDEDECIKPQRLSFKKMEENHQYPDDISARVKKIRKGSQLFKVGGVPSWAQEPEITRCSCGSSMEFLFQIPEAYRFPTKKGSPERASFYAKEYSLFVGNEIYVFTCKKQCDPRAIWIVVQN